MRSWIVAGLCLLAAPGAAQIRFVENAGQLPGDVAFHATAGRLTVFVRERGFVAQLRDVAMDGAPLRGANVFFEIEGARAAAPVGLDRLPGMTNYLLGQDPARFTRGARGWSRIAAHGVRPGVDLVFRADAGAIEYDVLATSAGALADVVFRVRGARSIAIDHDGALLISTEAGDLRQTIPAAYTIGAAGRGADVACRFRLLDPERFGFEVEAGAAGALVIDPILTYAGYLSGGAGDEAYAITTDSSGAVYTAGRSASLNYPTSPGAFDPTLTGAFDGFVTKADPTGSVLVYSTYIGSSGTDLVHAIAVNGSGQATITGLTGSGFPTTAGAYDTTYAGWKDAFVTRLDATGSSLVFSTYLGGTHDDFGTALAIDGAGNLYVGGKTRSTNFPVSATAVQAQNAGFWDGFVARLNPTATSLSSATYLGGAGLDWIHGIAVTSGGALIVAGSTDSPDFPTTPGAFDTTPNGSLDAFVARMTPAVDALSFATLLGGPGLDHAHAVAIGPDDVAYVVGVALPGFPSTPGAYDTANSNGDAYLARLNSTGDTLLSCTFIGESGTGQADAVAVDVVGAAYLTGFTTSTDFPVTPGATMPQFGGGGAPGDAFFAKIGALGNRLDYATYFGGSGYEEGRALARGAGGAVFIAGSTSSTNLPAASGAFAAPQGLDDGFFARFTLPLAQVTTLGPAFAATHPAPALSIAEPPVLGHPVWFLCASAPPSAAGGVVASAPAPTTLMGGIAPLYVDPMAPIILTTFQTSPAGTFAFAQALPADAALAGAAAHVQAAFVNPANVLGIDLSNGLLVTLGY